MEPREAAECARHDPPGRAPWLRARKSEKQVPKAATPASCRCIRGRNVDLGRNSLCACIGDPSLNPRWAPKVGAADHPSIPPLEPNAPNPVRIRGVGRQRWDGLGDPKALGWGSPFHVRKGDPSLSTCSVSEGSRPKEAADDGRVHALLRASACFYTVSHCFTLSYTVLRGVSSEKGHPAWQTN